MALSKGFRIFEKKQPNHSIILEHRQRSQEALLFESQAVAVLCKNFSIVVDIDTFIVIDVLRSCSIYSITAIF